MLRALHTRQKLPMLEHIYNSDSLTGDVWDKRFAEVMKEGGFDVIIGNPPYVRQESLGETFKAFAKQNFETYAGTADLYIYFIEKAHKLLKPGGYFGMIVSNKWMRSSYGKALRDFLIKESALEEIIDFGELPVFDNAATFPTILITQHKPVKKQHFLYAPIKRLNFISLPEEIQKIGTRLNEKSIKGNNWALSNDYEQVILEKMNHQSIPIHSYIKGIVNRGIVTGCNDVFVINQSIKDVLISKNPNSAELIKPFIIGDDVRKYHFSFRNRYLLMPRHGIDIEHYPAILEYLSHYKERLMPKPENWQGDWHGRKPGYYKWYEIQDSVKYYEDFERPKIIYPEIAMESRFAFDDQGYYCNKTIFIIPGKDLYLLGILNSKLAWLFLKRTCSVLGDPDKRGRLLMQYIYLKQLPIRQINFTDISEKSAHDAIVSLVGEILQLQKDHSAADRNLDDRRFDLQKRITQVDAEIDQLVYRLYGLTDEEIAVVEGRS